MIIERSSIESRNEWKQLQEARSIIMIILRKEDKRATVYVIVYVVTLILTPIKQDMKEPKNTKNT